MTDLQARFKPGSKVRVDDIEMVVVAVQFEWGMTFPRYRCEWWQHGEKESAWIYEPELEGAE